MMERHENESFDIKFDDISLQVNEFFAQSKMNVCQIEK